MMQQYDNVKILIIEDIDCYMWNMNKKAPAYGPRDIFNELCSGSDVIAYRTVAPRPCPH